MHLFIFIRKQGRFGFVGGFGWQPLYTLISNINYKCLCMGSLWISLSVTVWGGTYFCCVKKHERKFLSSESVWGRVIWFIYLSFYSFLRYSWSIINCTYLRYKVWWVLTYVYNCCTIVRVKIINISIIPRVFSCPLAIPSSLHPCLWATTGLLSATLNYPKLSRISYKWNCTVCAPFFLVSFTQQMILIFIHAVVSINSIFYLIAEYYSSVRIYHSLLILSSIWALGFLALSYYK